MSSGSRWSPRESIDVDKTFDGDVRAVIDLNAEFENGERASMLGPSGYPHSRRAVSETAQRA